MKDLIKKLSLLFCSLFVSLIFGEVFLRVIYKMNFDSPLPYGIRDERTKLDLVKLKSNFIGKSKTGVYYSTNEKGFRDDAVDYQKKHVIFLGDSTTFGLNINHDDTYPEIFEKLMKVQGADIQSINTASPGQGTLDELDVLKSVLLDSKINPVAVVIGFYGNDFANNMLYVKESDEIKTNDTWYEFKRFFKKSRLLMYLNVFLRYKLPQYAGEIKDFPHKLVIKDEPQTDEEKINQKYVLDDKMEFQQAPGVEIELDLLEEGQILDNRSYKLTVNSLERILEIGRQNNLPLIFLYLPKNEKEIVENKSPRYKFFLEKYLVDKGVLYVDALKIYQKYLSKNNINGIKLPEGFYSENDDAGHPGPLAAKLIAEAIVEEYFNLNINDK